MSTNESRSSTEDSTQDDAYATIEMPQGGVVIYATADHCQWLQSDTAVELEELR
jgi:hypothetical protein